MPSNTPNLSDALHEFDKSKQYKRVVFQQGKPILDIDLNDMTEAIEAQTQSLLIEKMGFGPPQLDYREWAIRSVDGDPTSTRNNHNMAFTLGRLDTRKGIVDTTHLKDSDPNKENSVIFDTYKMEVATTSNNTDRLYANYILKGAATGGTTNKLIDANKNFVADMGLGGISYNNTVTREYSTLVSQVNSLQDTTSVPFHINIEESACRVVFVGNVTAALANVSRNITGVNGTTLTLDGANLPSAPVNGDQYYIVPANTMEEYATLYNATTTKAASLSEGLTGLPQLMPYVQVFEEDISSEEDSSIQSTLLGSETTHRTQLRWCIRIAKVKMSIDGDQYNSVNVGNLELSHIFTRFNAISEYEYQTMLDSVDATVSNDPTFFQTHFWKEFNQDGTARLTNMEHQASPYKDLGLSPLHFFNAEEMTLDRLMWGYLKAELLTALGPNFNDVQILALFNSESKTATGDPANETLDPVFFPGKVRGTTEPIVHSFLSVSFPTDQNFTFSYTEVVPGKFKSPPKIFSSQADVGLEEMKSRSLFGYKGGLIVGPTAPLVFKSQSEHIAFLDQIVMGMSGLGSVQGITTQYDESSRLPSSVDYYLDNTTSSLAQSGYGLGSINPISPISSAARPTGFIAGSQKYLLREKGSRASHEVNWDDDDFGWSFFKKEDTELRGDATTPGPTNLAIRQWDEGPAQAVAFQNGINFRKLAIKTIAHKSMDLFTISEVPPNENVNYFSSQTGSKFSAIGFQYPKGVVTTTSLLGLDSYSGVGSDIATLSSFKSSLLYHPTTNTEYNLPALINGYRPPTAMITHGGTRDSSNTDLSAYYGPWNRFDSTEIETNAGAGNPSNVPMDTWANRCTSMRLRYHIGDFYPGSNDSRGIPANELVDSLNLFVRVEPLSLTHWMTMPKHQHSILENSFSMAEGIEALLKVSHGLGDTQKLINSSNQPLVQSTSPAQTVGLPNTSGTIVQADVGTVDALDLPFDYHAHPFVHWYHPAQHLITGPHPSGHRYSGGEKYTVYPKFGRRSMIIPALVPFEGIGDTDTLISTPNTIQDLYDDRLSLHDDTNSELTAQSGNTMGIAKFDSGSNTHKATLDRSVFPYLPHSTRAEDQDLTKAGENAQTVSYVGGSFTIRENSFVFPHVPQDNQSTVPGPVFIPASRQFAKQDFNQSAGQLDIGFYQPYLSENPYTKFPNDLTEIDGTTFPYDEYLTHYLKPNDTNYPSGTDFVNKLGNDLVNSYPTWSVPVLRAAIRTTTVASIVDLVRTSFTTALSSGSLSSEYTFTMPATSHTAQGYSNQTPGLGPDSPVDTLFAGDTGTATGGRLFRSGFMNPLNLGMGSYIKDLGLVSNYLENNDVINDSFQYSKALMGETAQANTHILDVFTALSRQGLQQKLLWNCSFRVLHHRPNGRTNNQTSFLSTAPKSLTEVFLAHDRTENATHTITNNPFTGVPSTPNKKPYINLLAMHPGSTQIPGSIYFRHLYPMVSDSTGGSQTASSYTDSSGILQYNYSQPAVQTSSMGDTFAADPFDYAMSQAQLAANNPMRATENTNRNSGIEIELMSELNRAFTNKTALNLDGVATINGTNFSLIDTMPSANELTLPGDHEIVFVLYTGHYGLKIHDTDDDVDTSYIPSVAGCHLTATIEVNRPSERKDSTSTDEHHYGKTVDGNPIKTYSILSSKE